MASEIRVNTINNRSGLGTISITNSGAVFSGVTTFAQIKTTSGEVTVGTGASVFSPATNVLALGTNNTEKVRISSTGSVGIGTDNPATNFKLDVNGDLSLGEYNGSDNTYIDQKQNGHLNLINSGVPANAGAVRINKTNTIGGDTTYFRDFVVYDGKNNVVQFIDGSSGNIGIGTDNPVANFKLDVNGDLSLGEFGGTDDSFIDQKQDGHFDIINSGRQADNGRIRINRVNSISGDTTYYRDFELYDGKSNKIIEVDGSAAMTRIHMGTDKVVQFQGNIGEIGSVTGFQATNTAGSANTDFGIRATTIRFATGNSERLRIDSSGNAILKSAGAAFKAENPSSSGDYLRMYANGTAQWDIYTNGELLRFGDNSGNSSARVQFDNPTFHRSTSNTTGVAAVSAKQEVNNGGYLIYEGKNSSDTTVFSVTHNGRINLSENIVFASGQGIDFSATSDAAGMTSELLDDYEEGTWTPTLSFGGTACTMATGGGNAGRYVKVGGMCYCSFNMNHTSKNSSSGSATLGGFPFSSLGATLNFYNGYIQLAGGCSLPTGCVGLMLYQGAGGSTSRILVGTTTGHSDLNPSQVANNQSYYAYIVYAVG